MKNIILGTAGHVDHGKTSLIRVLTGIDTDRLKEEKERGITIELGFAHLALPSGQRVGIIDVPGHERFIKTMVSGATGIDLVALVIAADEGVMPQTREHLQICSFLGIKKGLVAVTKTDLVDNEWLELVISDTRDFLKGSFLEEAAIVPVSAATGRGLKDFVLALDRLASEAEAGYDPGVLRLPIDRVFTMKGFGTVVTGTLVSGTIKAGDVVRILPKGLTAKVRGMQVHNEPVESTCAGQRSAVNLQGLDKTSIERGDVVTSGPYFTPSRRLDIHFEYLRQAKRKLKNRSLVRFHLKTAEIMARLVLLDRQEVEPGESAFAQLFLASPACAMAKDRFVIRSYSPVATIGGGEIIDPESKKLKRQDLRAVSELTGLFAGSGRERTAGMIRRAGLSGITLDGLVVKTGIKREELEPLIQELIKAGETLPVDSDSPRLLDTQIYRRLNDSILSTLAAYHERNPYREGMAKEELRTAAAPFIGVRLFNLALKDLVKSEQAALSGESVRLFGHRLILQEDLVELRDKISGEFLAAGLTPPEREAITTGFSEYGGRVADILNILLKEGVLVRIKGDFFLHRQVLARLKDDYRELLLKKEKATPGDFKDLTGLSRKHLIPLLEYFDLIKFTIRTGEYRILKTANQRGPSP